MALKQSKIEEYQMYKTIITTSFLVCMAATSVAAKNTCAINSGQKLTKSISDTDGGTKPHARVTATITAHAGYFILTSSISTDSSGTRRGHVSKLAHKSHPAIKGFLEPLAAISASFTQSCKHRNVFGTSSCTATAKIDAREYPIACLADIVASSLPAAIAD